MTLQAHAVMSSYVTCMYGCMLMQVCTDVTVHKDMTTQHEGENLHLGA